MRPTFLCIDTGEGAMRATACGLVADLIDSIEGRCSDYGRPRCPTEAVVETLRFFLREGVQWRELRATGDRVGGPRLRGLGVAPTLGHPPRRTCCTGRGEGRRHRTRGGRERVRPRRDAER